MPDDAAAYLLLVADVLVVAVVLSLPILIVWWLLGRLRARRRSDRRRQAHRRPSTRSHRTAAPAGDGDDPVLRRCDACGVGWKGRPADDARVSTLRLRRWKRRRTREKKQDTPVWASRRGWSRCPSCLSTDVRTSSRDTGQGSAPR